HDRENGLRLFFHSPCMPEATEEVAAAYRCVLTERFITSARVNALVQAFPNLIDDRATGVQPHFIERMFGFLSQDEFKNLKIKLGLDLQGGMRAIFQADFDSYTRRLQEKYAAEIESLESQLRTVTDEEERQRLSNRLEYIQAQIQPSDTLKRELLARSKMIIDKRLANQNLTEPEVRVQEESYTISVDMPGVANSTEVLQKIGDPVTVTYRLVRDQATERLNARGDVERQEFNRTALQKLKDMYRKGGVDEFDVKEILESVAERNNLDPVEDGRLFLSWGRRTVGAPMLPDGFRVLGPPILSGDDMKEASANVDQRSGYYLISFALTDDKSEEFGDITREHVGERLAILWGDRVVSDPNIQGPIYGGNGQITGQFSREEAQEIANVISEGALPMDLEVISVSFVGPSLGQESIISGMISILLGFSVVILFMLGYYRMTGWVAVAALFLNLLIMAAIMSLLEFTLTLPGFAGVILTVGMAVDANVIIFEKIKEDLRSGKAASVAIDGGFEASFWTILDANLTTLIAAIILYIPKDGPIMGFAVVLFFGLLSSMFTALFVSRLLLDWSQYLFRIRNLSIGWGFKKE
ncbi:MAG: protein translocase subunit SecD, partial [Leptospiraceae bacterium]|nr:protein translocase subunit SecD [Leptospiraceae bacterium]